MLKRHYVYVIFWVFSVCNITINAQDSSSAFPTLTPNLIRSLEIKDGLPTPCFEQMFFDETGRMWLVPCADAQSIRGLHLIQFDGYQGDVHAIDLPIGSVAIFSSIFRDSLLAGILIDESEFFIYNIHSQTTHHFHVQNQAYRFCGIQVISNRIFILASLEDETHILELKDGEFLIRGRIADFIPYINTTYIIGMTSKFLAIGHDIWLTGKGQFIYRFNIDNGQLDTFSAPNQDEMESTFLLNWNGQILVGYENHKQYHLLTLKDTKFISINLLPPNWSYSLQYTNATFSSPVYADRTGWLFVNARDSAGVIRQVLINEEGITLDYSAIYNAIPGPGYGMIAGKDFTKDLISFSGGVNLIQVTKPYGFQRVSTYSARSMVSWDNQLLFLLTDIENYFVDVSGSSVPKVIQYPNPGIFPMERNSIFRDDDGSFWFAGNKVLKRFDPERSIEKQWKAPGKITAFLFDQKKILFISDGALYILNPEDEEAEKIIFTGTHNSIEGYPNAMIADQHILWIASSAGLWRADLAQKHLEKVQLEHWPNIALLALYKDTKGNLWMGTETSGILQYNPQTKEIISCNHEQGLSHNTVVGILEDDDHHIWASTFYGINVLNENVEMVASFYQKDGLIHNEGNRWSHYKLPDGRLIFGSTKGLTIFEPAKVLSLVEEQPIPKVYCKSVSFFSKNPKARLTRLNPDFKSTVFRMPANQRSIVIHAGTTDYLTSSDNEYLFRIKKPGIDWVLAGTNPSIVINNLPPGKYAIQVQARNSNGILTSNIIDIQLDVAEYFYKQWWFFVLCAIPFLIFSGLWFRRNQQERYRLEREVRQRTAHIAKQTEELKQLDQAKTRLYTNITHEFRTPLTVIKGATEFIEGNDEQKTILKRNTHRLLNLVNQLLELSKLESGKMVPHMVHVNAVHLIRDIFESFLPIAVKKDVSMHFYAPAPDILMDVDIEIFHRIVGNLLSNALKFTPAGGNIYVDIQTTSSGKAETPHIQFTIRDTGIGIDPEKIELVFKRFYQVDDSTTRAGEGTGIGLALTRELIEFLHGEISVHSVPGQGSAFTVTLPIMHKAAPEAARQANPSTEIFLPLEIVQSDKVDILANDHSEWPMVLIVEDNPDVIHYLVNCLRSQYRIQIAADGEDGVSKAIQIVPDLIISDVMMPRKDGLQLCAELKQDEHTSHVPIILLTAKADVQSRIEGLSLGADAYLSKPFERDELLITARNLIETRRALRTRYLAETPISKTGEEETHNEDAFMIRVNELIDAHLDNEDYGVMPLSIALKYSRAQVHNKVKALTGMSTSGYIQHRRLIHAKKLLLAGQINVSEVAYAVGFRDPNYFSRVFKKEFGVSPTDFQHPASDSELDIQSLDN